MKKLIMAGFCLLTGAVLFAQPPHDRPKPPQPEERWQHDSNKISESVKLDAKQLEKAKTVFMSFYKTMDELHAKVEKQNKEQFDKVVKQRNDELKKVLPADQYDAFMKMEKQLGPPKRKGPGEMPPPPKQL